MIQFIILFLTITGFLIAQNKGMELDFKDMMQTEAQGAKIGELESSGKQFFQANIVEPDFYYLGPGDIITLKVTPVMMVEKTIELSPEVTFLPPRYGKEISLKGLTLSQAKVKIDSIFQSLYPKCEVNFTLKKPKLCYVKVSGDVNNPGSLTVPSTMRISQVISMANSKQGNEMSASLPEAMEKFNDAKHAKRKNAVLNSGGIPQDDVYWRRNITVRSSDYSIKKCDLERALVVDSYINDPYVREGDDIFVATHGSYEKISIAGAVVKPYSTEFRKGDKASLLIALSLGFKESADLDNVKLYSPSQGEVNLNFDNSGYLLNDPYLEAGSFISVSNKRNYVSDKFGFVSVKGYFQNEGIYQIEPGISKLSEIVDQAGGFTPNAGIALGRVYRFLEDTPDKPEEGKLPVAELFSNSDLSIEDTTRFFIDVYNSKNNVSCDFSELFINKNDKADVVLQNNDVIFVPKTPNSVYVLGKVNRPGFVSFESKKNLDYYVNRAGGKSDAAEMDRARIIRGSTYSWVHDSEGEAEVYDGDIIYVPGKPDIPLAVDSQVKAQETSVLLGIFSAIVSLGFLVTGIINLNRR